MLTPRIPARRRRRDDWHRSDGGVWLPRDPLRGAGMVRRGMGFGFEPAGCCCEKELAPCTYCNALDKQYDITLAGFSDTTHYSGSCGNLVATGCNVINGTFRVSWVSQRQVRQYNNECSGAFYEGCVWEGYFADKEINLDWQYCTDYKTGFILNLFVKQGSSAGKIDVAVHVGFYYQNHQYLKTDVTCGSGCLDGLEVPACGSYDLNTYGSPAGCFEGGLTGSATIDAVAA